MTAEEIAELRTEVDLGIEDADQGRFVEFTAEQIIAEGRDRLAAEQAKARKGA